VSEPSEHGSPDRSSIGWPRAILTAVVVLAVAVGVGVVGANAALTNLTGLSRDARMWIATALTMMTVIGLGWALRRLQARGLV